MSFEVLHPGTLALLQDRGRFGRQHLGMATGGALDERALLWAQRLLDNPPGACAIELTLGGLRLRATAPIVIALTGADCDARIDGAPADNWCTHALAAGAELAFGPARTGLRAYLAVRGGLRVAPHFGSCATVPRERLGGLRHDGAPLRRGDRIDYEACAPLPRRSVPAALRPDYATTPVLRVVPGYQFERFPADERARLFDSQWTISPRSDRMGCRLDGPPLRGAPEGLVSEGIALGAIQVPPDGAPIILLRDRQTIGGYARLGCVASLDCSRLAQCAPGTRVRFAPAPLAELIAERRAFDAFFGLGPAP